MNSSIRTQIGMLVVATSVVQFANGFFGTYISLRVAVEGFDVPGLVLSAYFAGFTLGALVCNRVIERIGHIRAYAAFAGLVAAAVALMPLLINSLSWVSLRAIVGFGCAGIFVTTESWLTAKAEPSQRGRVFSVYMVGTFLALALGQLLIARADIRSAASFNVIVALFAVALIMVTAARAEAPRASTAPPVLPYGVLARSAPIAVIGCAVSGLVGGAFYALVPAWMQDQGTARGTIALFMLVAVLGGLAFQIPVGRLSDRFDRRVVLAFLSVGFAVTAIIMVFLPRSLSTILPAAVLLGGFMSNSLSRLRRARPRSHAGRSGRGGQRAAHPGERCGLGAGSADRCGCDGALRDRWRVLLHGGRGAPVGAGGRRQKLDGAIPGAPASDLRHPDPSGGAPCA